MERIKKENRSSLEEIVEAAAIEAINKGQATFPFDEDSYWLFKDAVENTLFLVDFSLIDHPDHSGYPHRRLEEAAAWILEQNEYYKKQLILESVETWKPREGGAGSTFQKLILHRRDTIADLEKRRLPLIGFSTIIKVE